MKSISILGSTGSIGRQTLEVCRDLGIKVNALSAGGNIDLLERQAREFGVSLVSIYDESQYQKLRDRLSDADIAVVCGDQGNIDVATYHGSKTVVAAISGMIGLIPTVEAIKAGKTVALANKETLVCAGHIIMPLARRCGVEILPVDSEHSAIFQCLNASEGNPIRKILLTASGGPFYGRSAAELQNVTRQDALKHPNWSMGSKITIDSATLMNKGLEVIEAKWLFGVDVDDIEVVIHRESIVHSAVEFEDDSVIAQLGVPQMYLPIKYALTYPARIASGSNPLSLFGKTLHFDKPDTDTFKCLPLAVSASKAGGLYPAVLNGANEKAVELFLKDKIGFCDIPRLVEGALSGVVFSDDGTLDVVIEANAAACRYVSDHC